MSDLKPGDCIGRYELTKSIGHGAMGDVWKASWSGSIYAIKIKFPKADVSRFANEVVTIEQCQNLNHVVTCFDSGNTLIGADEISYYVMEFLDGLTVKDVDEQLIPSPASACEIVKQAASALDSLHSKHIVHRDIKPENLILAMDDGHAIVKVIDFGLAKNADADVYISPQRKEKGLGTPPYAAPEQLANGSSADESADVYSLGVVLYELIKYSEAQRELTSLIQGMTSESPRDRPTAEEVVSELTPHCDGANLERLLEAARKGSTGGLPELPPGAKLIFGYFAIEGDVLLAEVVQNGFPTYRFPILAIQQLRDEAPVQRAIEAAARKYGLPDDAWVGRKELGQFNIQEKRREILADGMVRWIRRDLPFVFVSFNLREGANVPDELIRVSRQDFVKWNRGNAARLEHLTHASIRRFALPARWKKNLFELIRFDAISLGMGGSILDCADMLIVRPNAGHGLSMFLFHRIPNNPAGNKTGWEYPKGGMQYYEKPFEGAIREIHEETGIPSDELELLGELGEKIPDVQGRGRPYNRLRVNGFVFLHTPESFDLRRTQDHLDLDGKHSSGLKPGEEHLSPGFFPITEIRDGNERSLWMESYAHEFLEQLCDQEAELLNEIKSRSLGSI